MFVSSTNSSNPVIGFPKTLMWNCMELSDEKPESISFDYVIRYKTSVIFTTRKDCPTENSQDMIWHLGS